MSDFITDKVDRTRLSHAFKIARSRHDMVAIRVEDPREGELPDVGLVEFMDAESGERRLIDTSSRGVREGYADRWREHCAEIESILKHNKIDVASVSTDSDYVVELIKLFKQR